MRRFPRFPLSINNVKKRMGFDGYMVEKIAIPRGVAALEFLHQELPFIEQLAPRADNRFSRPRVFYFPGIEHIAPPNRFIMNSSKVRRYGCSRLRVGLKTCELRVAPVSFCFTEQDLLCEQSFTPERNQSPGIQIFGMQ